MTTAATPVTGKGQHKQHKHNKPVSEFSDNFALDRKIKEPCIGLKPSTQRLLLELPRDENRELIANYIIDWANTYGNGLMMSPNTKLGYITSLVYLSRSLGHAKTFKQMTHEDIIDGYLKSIRREFAEDPEQKWVNTYRTRAGKILAFWKWLTQPDLPASERQTPPELKGLKFPTKKIKTRVKHEHLWMPEEHKVFLVKCAVGALRAPSSKSKYRLSQNELL